MLVYSSFNKSPPPSPLWQRTANHHNDSIKLAFKLLFLFLAIFSWIWVQDYLGKNIKSLYLANFYSWRRHLLYFLKETQLISFLANHPSPDIITQSNQNLSTSEPDSKCASREFCLPVVRKQNKINFKSLVCEEQHTQKRAT